MVVYMFVCETIAKPVLDDVLKACQKVVVKQDANQNKRDIFDFKIQCRSIKVSLSAGFTVVC